jgi:hypothetical protein
MKKGEPPASAETKLGPSAGEDSFNSRWSKKLKPATEMLMRDKPPEGQPDELSISSLERDRKVSFSENFPNAQCPSKMPRLNGILLPIEPRARVTSWFAQVSTQQHS